MATIQLQAHQQRVIDEKSELDTKATGLSKFIGENPIFANLDAAEQERLREQCEVMWQYSEILGARIAAFLGDETPTSSNAAQSTPATHIQQNRRALISSLPIVLDAIDDTDYDLALEWIANMQSQLRGLHQLLENAKQNGVNAAA